MRRRQPQTDKLGLLLLLAQLWQQIEHLPVKPFVTLSLIAFMVAAHIEPSLVPFLNYDEQHLCLDPQLIFHSFQAGDYVNSLLRFFGSAFVHGSDMHLFYNMGSFVWKGSVFETRLGPGPFAVLITMLLVMAHGMFVVLGILIPGHRHCAIGFSGVIFALVRFMI